MAIPRSRRSPRTYKVHTHPSSPRREIPAHSARKVTGPLNCPSALNSGGQLERYRPLFGNTRRLRELISELETLSAEAVEHAEGWAAP